MRAASAPGPPAFVAAPRRAELGLGALQRGGADEALEGSQPTLALQVASCASATRTLGLRLRGGRQQRPLGSRGHEPHQHLAGSPLWPAASRPSTALLTWQ